MARSKKLPDGPGRLPPTKPIAGNSRYLPPTAPIEEISDPSTMVCPHCHSTNTRTIPGLVWCMACGEAQILTKHKGSQVIGR